MSSAWCSAQFARMEQKGSLRGEDDIDFLNTRIMIESPLMEIHANLNLELNFPAVEDKKSEYVNDQETKVLDQLFSLEQRNRCLQELLHNKDVTLDKLLTSHEYLKKELKRVETMRLAQLEMLALRNIELERELSEKLSNQPT